MKRVAVAVVVLLVAHAIVAAHPRGDGQASLESIGRVVRLLEDSGYRYTKAAEATWTITFKGEQKSSVQVLVMATDRQVIIEGVIALRKDVADEAELMRQLLKLNATVAGATLLIDEEGDYVARAWLGLRDLDSRTFKASLQAVGMAADTAYADVRGYLGASPAVSQTSRAVAGPASRAYAMPRTATRQLTFLNGKAAVSYDPDKWRETKSADPSKRTLQHTNGDGYAMIIAERIEMTPERLRDMALQNAREAAPDAKVLEEQRRRVNGVDLVMLRMEGTMNGVAFTYLGYYYGGPAGTIQVITYTGRNLFGEYRRDFEDFLNGFELR